MRSIETEGDTIDEAISKALTALQVGRDRVEIEILGSATRGVFGFGGRQARVRATIRESLASTLRTEIGQRGEPSGDVSRETTGRQEAEVVSRATPARSSTPVQSPQAPTAPVAGEYSERARQVLEVILGHIGASCRVELRAGAEPGEVVLGVSGNGSGLVIGRRGQTLDAIEYLLNRIASRGEDRASARLLLDVEGYRERRQESLEQLARRLAHKVAQTGRVVALNPMSPRDRRIVHLALQGSAGVMTRSQGDGYYRKVLILPEERVRGPRTSPDR